MVFFIARRSVAPSSSCHPDRVPGSDAGDRMARQRMLKSMTLKRQMNDYRLTTAEILYHLPDHPNLLQTFVWQDLDLAPQYPVLRKFLDFWHREIDGALHSVRVASCGVIQPGTVRHASALLNIH
jgi:uncharacterized protein Usg